MTSPLFNVHVLNLRESVNQIWQIHVTTKRNPCINFDTSLYQLREIHIYIYISVFTNEYKKSEKSIHQFWKIYLKQLYEIHVTTLINQIEQKSTRGLTVTDSVSDKARQWSDLGPIKTKLPTSFITTITITTITTATLTIPRKNAWF